MKVAAPSFERTSHEPNGDTYQYQSDLGVVAVIGQCMSPWQEFAEAAELALETNTIAPLQNLAGSYSIIANRGDNYIVDADPSGQVPIYWRPGADRPRFSTTSSDLGDRLNPRFLAAKIIACTEIVAGQSAFEGVQRLQGGETAYFTAGRLSRLQETVVAPNPEITLAEGSILLREALIEALDLRLRTGKTVTSDCSGGWDSSMLSLIVATMNDSGLDAFVQYMSGVSSGDLPYARRVAQSHDGLRLHEQPRDKTMLPFQALDDFTIPDEPTSWTVINARIRAQLAHALEYGSQIHLTGSGGDAVLDPPISYAIDLARQNRYEEVRAACQAYAQVGYMSSDQLVAQSYRAAGRTRSDDLRTIAHWLQDTENVSSGEGLGWLSLSKKSLGFLTGYMRRELSEAARQAAVQTITLPDSSVANFEASKGVQNNGNAQRQLRFLAHSMGLEVHAPYMDRNVIKACLQVPAYARAEPGEFKQILNWAFGDIMPDVLRSRRSKGFYNTELYMGLRAEKDRIIRLLSDGDCCLADLKIIEPKQVLQEIVRLDMGLGGMFPEIIRLVAAEIWLRIAAGKPL